LLVLGVYILTMSGHTYSPDEETMLETSRSLVTKGTWAMSPSHALVQARGIDGRMYSQYGPGQSLAAVPWVGAGILISNLFPKDQQGFPLRLVLGSYNALIMAGLAALFAAMGIALGYSRRAGIFSAGVLAFATFLWPHSRTFFSEPLVALALFASFYLLYIGTAPGLPTGDVQKGHWGINGLGGHPQTPGRGDPLHPPNLSREKIEGHPQTSGRGVPLHLLGTPPGSGQGDHAPAPPLQAMSWLPLAGSGALFALAVATKVQYVVTLPAFLLYLGWRFAAAGRSWRIPFWWLAGLLAGLTPLFLYNALIFGSPFATGYGANPGSTLTNPLLQGAFGLLLSPGKGLLWYAFPIVLTFFGWVPFARKHLPEAVFIVVLSLSVLVLFSLYSFWPGDGSWGPRYLTPALPFLLLPILPVVQWATTDFLNAKTPRRQGIDGFESQRAQSTQKAQSLSGITHYALLVAFCAVIAIGFLINLLGVLVNFDTYINVVNDDKTRYYTVDASPPVGHLNLLEERVNEWYVDRFPQSGTTLFRSGFSYSEGDKSRNELLPRWTTGSGVLAVHPDSTGPVSMTLRLADHRPPNLPRATLSILVNGSPAVVRALTVKDQPVSADYSFTLPPGASNVTIQTDTWNPSKYQSGGRNENLGLMLQAITLSQDSRAISNNLAEALPPPAYYPQPRWYYDPGTHFLADLWPVYLLSTGMGGKAVLAIALALVAVSLALILVGGRLLRGPADVPASLAGAEDLSGAQV
jgi:hypothetical protein